MTLFAGALIISGPLVAAESMVLRPQWPVGKKINHHIDRVIQAGELPHVSDASRFFVTSEILPATGGVGNLEQLIQGSVRKP